MTAVTDLGRDMRKISNSEVATWVTCKRKYYYEFDLNLEPNRTGTALSRGTLLHLVLGDYYQALKNGIKHSDAVIMARTNLQKFLASNQYALDVVMEVDKLTKGYWDFYQGDPDWQILEVEHSYDLTLTEDYTYSLRLDLLVLDTRLGKRILIDHKTAYNFWTEDDLGLNPQFPKYIGSLRANGTHVDYALLNQIRTREIKNPTTDQLFKRVKCVPSLAKVRNALQEQVVASEEISRHRMLPVEVRSQKALRCLNKNVCKYCDVKPLCQSEYDGGDITALTQSDFKQRTYGYNGPDVEELM